MVHPGLRLKVSGALLGWQPGLMFQCQHTTLIDGLLVALSHLLSLCTCLPLGTSTWRTACTCDAGRSTFATAPGTSSSG